MGVVAAERPELPNCMIQSRAARADQRRSPESSVHLTVAGMNMTVSFGLDTSASPDPSLSDPWLRFLA
jgi:hypothetical protein